MGNQVADYKWHIKVSNSRARLSMKLTIRSKVYIPSWVQFLDDFHPILLADQMSTEQMQRPARELNEQCVSQRKLYQRGDGDIRPWEMDEWKE
jgi:hypothetical protein